LTNTSFCFGDSLFQALALTVMMLTAGTVPSEVSLITVFTTSFKLNALSQSFGP
jgi:hypothetical protein